MQPQLVGSFDFRQQRNYFAVGGLALGGVGTWVVRSLILTVLRMGGEGTPDQFPFFLPGPFLLRSLAWSVMYWLAFALVLCGAALIARRDSVWIGLVAIGTTAFGQVMSLARGGLDPERILSWSAVSDVAVEWVGEALSVLAIVVVFRLTRRLGLTFVLGLPIGTVLDSLWSRLAQIAIDWSQSTLYPELNRYVFMDVHFMLTIAAASATPGLFLYIGYRLDQRRRGISSGPTPTRGSMPRALLVDGQGFVFLSALAVSAMLFGYLASERPSPAQVLLVLMALLTIASTVLTAILVHRMWRAIPAEHRRTTPGRAVGLLFVPLFNLYWVFQALAGFPTDWNRYRSDHPSTFGDLPRWPFVLTCILAIAASTPMSMLETIGSEAPWAIDAILYLAVLSGSLPPLIASMVCDAVDAAPAAPQE